MSQITKTQAAEIAVKMITEKEAKVTNAKQLLVTAFTRIYLESIPEGLTSIHEKFPDYFNTRRGFNLSGNGFNYQFVQTDRLVPARGTTFCPSKSQAKELKPLFDRVEKEEKDYKDLKKELEITLINLKTFKRISDNLPEAIPFLPTKMTTALVVNLESLREKLK